MDIASILLAHIPETLHFLSEKGEVRVEKDTELCPGINCCAVCARKVAKPVACPKCSRVEYCSQNHLKSDDEAHRQVCPLLALVNKIETKETKLKDVMLAFKKVRQLIKLKKMDVEDGWPIPLLTQPDGLDEEAADVDSERGDRDERQQPPKKKRKVGGELSSSPSPASSSAPSALSGSPGDKADASLIAFARCSYYLTYPLTAAYCLARVPKLRERLEKSWRAGKPATVCILGPSSEAELFWPRAWKLLDDFVEGPLRLVFAGPEVDATIAAASAPNGKLSEKLSAIFSGEVIGGAAGLGAAFPREAAAAADCLLAFNPGFTCPDYDWGDCLVELERACPSGLPPLFVSTNTLMEGEFDAEWLAERGWRLAAPPRLNPWTPLRPLQSGTLANDVYRKNAYVSCFVHRSAEGKAAKKVPAKKVLAALKSKGK